MGTYYTLGVIKKFTAKYNDSYLETDWQKFLNEKIDTTLFNLIIEDEGKSISGVLKEGIFENNIQDFYSKLIKITNKNSINYYFNCYGVDINKYYDDSMKMNFYMDENKKIVVTFYYVSLFIEGKVLVEEFSIEPKLMNWLFRHCNFGNLLSGCIISNIIG
jgi:hypothetical protein